MNKTSMNEMLNLFFPKTDYGYFIVNGPIVRLYQESTC